MNLRRLTRQKRVKDDGWGVAPSSSLIKRLMDSLGASHDIIDRYFPHNGVANEYLAVLEDMMIYFDNYK